MKEALFKSIVLIDDNEIDIFIAEKIMQSCNFSENIIEINKTPDVFEWLKNLHSVDTPDYIFLDINMNQFDITEFLSTFSELDSKIRCETKLIILSVIPIDDRIKSIIENEHVDKVICKPLTKNSLMEVTALNICGNFDSQQ